VGPIKNQIGREQAKLEYGGKVGIRMLSKGMWKAEGGLEGHRRSLGGARYLGIEFEREQGKRSREEQKRREVSMPGGKKKGKKKTTRFGEERCASLFIEMGGDPGRRKIPRKKDESLGQLPQGGKPKSGEGVSANGN